MKILFLKDSFDSGYENRDEVQYIIQALKNNHTATVVTSTFDLDFSRDSPGLKKRDIRFAQRYRIIRKMGFKTPFFHNIIFFVPLRRILKDDFNIIFIHNMGSFSSFLIPIINFLSRRGIILKSDFDMKPYNRARKNWLYRKIILLPAEKSDVIICYTKKEMDYLLDLGLSGNKIKIIPVGINYKKIPDLSTTPGNSKDKCTIGIIGRITEQKGHHVIIKPIKKILKEFPESRFLVAGMKSDRKYTKKFENAFDNYDNFAITGFVRDIYSDFFGICDIILIPSLHESGSIVCLEAMGAGKAVIASNINPHNDYIKSGKNGFLASETEDYYSICKKLIENPGLIKKTGVAARKSVSKYDWSIIGEKIEDIYSGFTSEQKKR